MVCKPEEGSGAGKNLPEENLNLLDESKLKNGDFEVKDKAGGPEDGGLSPGHVSMYTHHTGNGLCLRDLLL